MCAHTHVLGPGTARAGATICPAHEHSWENMVPGFSSHWHPPAGYIGGDHCNLRIYKVEPQVQAKRYGIVFSIFHQRWVCENVSFHKTLRSFLLWKKKNNYLPFPREKVTFFYEKETFCPEASEAVSGIAWQWVYIRTEQDAVPLAEMTFSSLFRVANSKKYKTDFLVIFLLVCYWCVQWHY